MTAPDLTRFRVVVPGDPKPQGSLKHIGKGRMLPDNPDMTAWRDLVTDVLRLKWSGPPLDQRVEAEVVFFLPKPKRPKFKDPATGYDLDKLQRAIGDAAERAGVLANDSRICRWVASKYYADKINPPGVIIDFSWNEDDL